MKFLVDENVHIAVFHFLKKQGFDVTSVAHDYSLKSEQPQLKIDQLKTLFQKKVAISGSFIVITEDRIRIRSLKRSSN